MLTHTFMHRGVIPVILAAALVSSASLLRAEGSGTMKGRVVDSETGEPLFGAIVVFQGTSIGAATDIHGEYVIARIPAGTVTVRVSYLGYSTLTQEVRIG
ncbi:MAG TPA: carboxypeptidase-like regulatory domain-containing protein, partial [Bacteroidota bacterium]|nr:carboxypeptidase-like regulatory domain-containing protein [Bacteroidota bacterium]